MLKKNEIGKSSEHNDFLNDLKKLLRKHHVTIIYGKNHIEFHKENAPNFAQCCCVGGISKID